MSGRYFLPLVVLAGLLPRVYLFLQFGLAPSPVASLCFAAFVGAHYCLALSATERRTAFAATILVAASPAFLVIATIKAPASQMCLLLSGTLALLLAARALDSGYSPRLVVLLGLTLGLTVWSNLLGLLYVVPIAVTLLLKDERKLLQPWMGAGLAGGFFLGSIPIWILRFTLQSRFLIGSERMQQTGLVADQRAFFGTALPIVLGWRRNGNGDDLFWHAGWAAIGLVMLCSVVLSVRWFKGSSPERFKGRHLLLIFALGFPLVFSCIGLGWSVAEPFYLLALYSILFILLLLLPSRESVRLALFGLLLTTNILGTLRISRQEIEPPATVGIRNYEVHAVK